MKKFDPNTLPADTVSVELEIGPSVLLLYGTALKNFLNFKVTLFKSPIFFFTKSRNFDSNDQENIFGDDQKFTDMQSSTTIPENTQHADLKTEDSSGQLPLELQDDFDHRNYRPLEVDVSIIMHDIQGHLLKVCSNKLCRKAIIEVVFSLLQNCTERDPACPVILVERFAFEMKKRYDQTELQLLVSPSILLVSDNVPRPSKDKHLNQGRLTLSSLQVNRRLN